LIPNPCPGCASVEGCIEVKDAAKTLDAITPSCLEEVEEG
jgi:hypothetical protein